METPEKVYFVVKRYAVHEAKKWQYAVRKVKIERYAICKGDHPPYSDFVSVTPKSAVFIMFVLLWRTTADSVKLSVENDFPTYRFCDLDLWPNNPNAKKTYLLTKGGGSRKNIMIQQNNFKGETQR